jgi:hypothetical protein
MNLGPRAGWYCSLLRPLLTPPPRSHLASLRALIPPEVHKKHPAATVSYTSPLPSIDALMQELPPEVEAALRGAQLPAADLVRRGTRGRVFACR